MTPHAFQFESWVDPLLVQLFAPRGPKPNRGDDDSGGGVVRTRHDEASNVSSRQRVERVQVEDVSDLDVNLEAQTEVYDSGGGT